MDYRHKYLVNTIRTLLGALLLFSGVTGFLMGPQPAGIPENMVSPTQALWDTGIFQLIKATEIVTGIMLLAGFLPWLALLAVAPIAIGIVVVNARMSPEYLPLGLIVGVFAAYLGFAYWKKYRQLFERQWR